MFIYQLSCIASVSSNLEGPKRVSDLAIHLAQAPKNFIYEEVEYLSSPMMIFVDFFGYDL